MEKGVFNWVCVKINIYFSVRRLNFLPLNEKILKYFNQQVYLYEIFQEKNHCIVNFVLIFIILLLNIDFVFH